MNFLNGWFINFHQASLCIFFFMTILIFIMDSGFASPDNRFGQPQNQHQRQSRSQNATRDESVYLTIHGSPCKNRCDQHGHTYYWCRIEDGGWNYCSLTDKLTRYDQACTSDCTKTTKSYYWCYTSGSWDYCSPQKQKP